MSGEEETLPLSLYDEEYDVILVGTGMVESIVSA